MRRKEKEITDPSEIEAVIRSADICHLGLCSNNKPYVIPMNFGYTNKKLYFHSASEGKKIDMIKENPNASFVIEEDLGLLKSEKACNWSHKFKSIMGSGTILILENMEEKKTALNILMTQYSDTDYTFPDNMVKNICIFVLNIEEMCGKQSKD